LGRKSIITFNFFLKEKSLFGADVKQAQSYKNKRHTFLNKAHVEKTKKAHERVSRPIRVAQLIPLHPPPSPVGEHDAMVVPQGRLPKYQKKKDASLEAALRRNCHWVVNSQIKRLLLGGFYLSLYAM